MTSPERDQREAFENWAGPLRPGFDLTWFTGADGEPRYYDPITHTAWTVWQACASAKDARIAELETDLRQAIFALSKSEDCVAAARAQLTEAQKDAERYRWLRCKSHHAIAEWAWDTLRADEREYRAKCRDERIDAAISAQGGRG